MVVEPVKPTHENSDPIFDPAEPDGLAKSWSPQGRAALKEKILRELPRWYSPLAHFLFPAVVGLGVIIGCCLAIRGLRAVELLTIPLTFILSNAVEWRAHKHTLHQRSRLMPILYDRHTPLHHRLYQEDSLAITDWRELSMVLLPSFGIVAILSVTLPLLGVAILFGLRNVALLFTATSTGYVLLYEWLHLTYHLPVDSVVGRNRLVRRLRRHHARHHNPRLMQRWNMNVTLPLWDWLRGTIYSPPAPGVAADAPAGSARTEMR